MIISIDVNSDEAFYLQIRNQVILAIATDELKQGEYLPSVRDLAETIGINMHTVHKAYGLLKEEGYLQLDRRRGAVIAVNVDELRTQAIFLQELKFLIARGICKGMSRDKFHQMVDIVCDDFGI